jgi:hypothetical protein
VTHRVLAVVLALTFAALQIPATGAQAPPGAVLAGVVVTADSPPQPVRRAIVTLAPSQGTGVALNQSAITDDQGRFSFTTIAPGRYTATASKVAYLTSAYGATRPGRPGTPIAVGAGERRGDLRIVLPRGAAITGIVRDPAGDPAANVVISLARAESATELSGYVERQDRISTDDRGVYRAFGLAPGDYLVAATPIINDVDNVARLSEIDIDARLRALRTRAPASSALPTTSRAAAAAEPGSAAGAERFAYAPIFYPGTANVSSATPVRVGAGEERAGIDFTIDLVQTVRVSGTVVTADGSPYTTARLSITPIGPPLPYVSDHRLAARPVADTRFTFESLTPGRYLLLAQGIPGTPPAGKEPAVVNGGIFELVPEATMFAMTEIAVTNVDVTGIALILRPMMNLSGRVVFESAPATTPPDLTKVRVGLGAASAGQSMTNRGQSFGVTVPEPVTAAADGTFRVPRILPGTYTVAASVAGAGGWWLKSAVVKGRDLLDTLATFTSDGGDISDAVLTFTDRHTEIGGTLQTSSGAPAPDYSVVVFPSDRTLWTSGARRIRATRPADDGRFSVVDLPAGEYLIAALTDVEPNEWLDPAFLTQLVSSAVTVTLSDGARVRQDLQIR